MRRLYKYKLPTENYCRRSIDRIFEIGRPTNNTKKYHKVQVSVSIILKILTRTYPVTHILIYKVL